MKRAALAVLFVSVFAVFAGVPAFADSVIVPVVQYTSIGTVYDYRPFTFGYEFTTTTTFTIDALGVWDNGLGQDQQAGIWDSSGDLLVSTTVSGAAADIDNFQWADVSYSLAPGTYLIGATYDNGGGEVGFPIGATGITTLPGYTWVTDEQTYGTGLNFPATSTSGYYGNNGVLWADFSAVPEPSSLLLLGTGLLGVLGAMRRKFAKAL